MKKSGARKKPGSTSNSKSLESWIWDAACSIRGAKDAPKYKDYIHTSDAETYRPIAEIVDELDAIESDARETDKALRDILKKLGLGP